MVESAAGDKRLSEQADGVSLKMRNKETVRGKNRE